MPGINLLFDNNFFIKFYGFLLFAVQYNHFSAWNVFFFSSFVQQSAGEFLKVTVSLSLKTWWAAVRMSNSNNFKESLTFLTIIILVMN